MPKPDRLLATTSNSLIVKRFKITKDQKIKISDFPVSLKDVSLTLVNPFNIPESQTFMLEKLLKLNIDKNKYGFQSWKFFMFVLLVLGVFFMVLFIFYRKRRAILMA